MKCRNIALLTLAPLLLLPLGATSGSTDPETALVSPDGVALWDFTQHSTVWGRAFDFNPPEGVHEKDIFSLCEFEGPGAGAAKWACLEPYIADVQWSVPGTPGSFQVLTIDEGSDPGNGLVPEPPLLGFGTASTVSASIVTLGFTIQDEVDSSSKAAEGFVLISALLESGWLQSSALFCDDQSASLGWCGQGIQANFDIVSLGANNCNGIKGIIEFWDDDGAGMEDDDIMDISTRLNDAGADIEATTEGQSGTCSGEDGLWWSERGNTDSPLLNRCHEVLVDFSCTLTGVHDTTGDHDDATIDASVLFN